MFLYCGPLVAAALIASQCAGRLGDGLYCGSQRGCHALAAKQAAPDDIASSKLLPENPTALQKEKMQFLKSALSLNDKKLEMFAKRPKLFSSSINAMERRLQYLQARLSLNKKQLSKMVQRLPALLQYGTDKNIEAKLQYLQKRLMLDEKELLKCVRTQPSIFTLGIENLEQKLVFIQSRLSLDDKELSSLLKKVPPVLFLKPEILNQKLTFWQDRLLLDENQLSKFVRKYPSLLTLSTAENIEPKLEYLQKRLSMDDEQLREVVTKLPSLLGTSIEFNLEPTITFFESLIGVNVAKALLIANPYIVTRSLEKRIKPRVAEVQEEGLLIDAAALVRIAMFTEEKWMASVAYQKKKLLLSKGELW